MSQCCYCLMYLIVDHHRLVFPPYFIIYCMYSQVNRRRNQKVKFKRFIFIYLNYYAKIFMNVSFYFYSRFNILSNFTSVQTIVANMYDNQNVQSRQDYCMFLHHIFVIILLIQLVCYRRQIKLTYHRQHANYQNDIVDRSNRPIINIMLSIRTVQQTNQTDPSQTLC